MKPTIDLLKKALRECAKAHRAEFSDWTEGQLLPVKTREPA